MYDTQGRALIRFWFDAVVLPFNDRLEGFITDFLPQGEDPPKPADLSNELSRTWRLAPTAVNRARHGTATDQ